VKIYLKDVAPLGFKGSGMFSDSRWHHFYYLEQPKQRRFYIIDSLDISVSHFNLTAREYKRYKQNELSLIPLGCCDAGCSNRETKENPIIDFKGDIEKIFKTKKKFIDYLKGLIKC